MYTVGAFWTSLGALVVAIASGLVGAIIAWLQLRPAKARLTYGIPYATALLSSTVAKVRVLHENNDLNDPYIVKLRLVSSGRHSIRSSHFDGNRPLRLPLDARPVAVLSIRTRPREYVAPDLLLDEHEVQIMPTLIHRGQIVEYEILVDGPPELTIISPLADVRLKRDDRNLDKPDAGFMKRVLTWGGIAFLLFFIAIRPASAANVFESIGETVGGLVTSIIL
jgi:hypothetical protein